MKCFKVCKEKSVACPIHDCRYWVEHQQSYNCTFGVIENANGPLTLEKVGEILNLTAARISQIQTEAIKKIKKSNRLHVLQ
jgi:hypothetical protein